MRYFDAPLAGQVRIEQELFLQFQRLIAAVGLSAPSPAGSCVGKDALFPVKQCLIDHISISVNEIKQQSLKTLSFYSLPLNNVYEAIRIFLRGVNSSLIYRCHKAFNWG